jgi:hypothetical protein
VVDDAAHLTASTKQKETERSLGQDIAPPKIMPSATYFLQLGSSSEKFHHVLIIS